MNTAFSRWQHRPAAVGPAAKINSTPALLEMLDDRREEMKATLSADGLILIRGFVLSTTEDFEDVVRAFGQSELFDYSGGVSPRAAIAGKIYNSTEYSPSLSLTLHNELSYSKIYPRYVYFFCLVPPGDGGETTYGDSRKILAHISSEILDEFRAKGVCYERNLLSDPESPYSWQAAFETDDPKAVSRICKQLAIDLTWRHDGAVRLIQYGPATINHPETGEEVWFNQAEGFHESSLDEESKNFFENTGVEVRLRSRFGDGSEIPNDYLEHIRKAVLSETKAHRWQQGDVLILDNLLCAHGRRPFSGRRRIAVAMT